MEEILERLASIERKVDLLFRALRLERRNQIIMEDMLMINFDNLAASLAKIQGAEASTEALVADLKGKLAELSASISDPADQAKVDEFAAAFAAVADKLPQAVAANPAPADAGASAGGITA